MKYKSKRVRTIMIMRTRSANAKSVIKRPMEGITKVQSSMPVNNLSLG
jgi:hypothetical protein